MELLTSLIINHLLLTSSFAMITSPDEDRHHHHHKHHHQNNHHHKNETQNVPVVNSCLPPPEVGNKTCREQPLSIVEMALNAKTLLYGRILNTYKDKRVEHHPRVSVFTAEMQVYCIIKGDITQKVVNISEAGYVPGRCYKSNLEIGNEYVVVVYPINDLLCTVDDEILALPDNMEKITRACHLHPRYPLGVTEDTAVKKCPITPIYPLCLNNDHYTTTEDNQDDYEDDSWLEETEYPLVSQNSSPQRRAHFILICILTLT